MLLSDGMNDYLAENMVNNLLDNTYDDLNVKILKSIPKETGHKASVESFPHTAQPLFEPRRHLILSSNYNGTNNQINQEYNRNLIIQNLYVKVMVNPQQVKDVLVGEPCFHLNFRQSSSDVKQHESSKTKGET